MPETYALRVQIESHKYDGEFYLVGEGYGTPADVLDNVAADHLLRIANARRIEEYLLNVLKHGENTAEAEYEVTDSDVECWIHADVSYQRYAFGVRDSVFEFSGVPTKSEIASTVTQLQS
ncbi:hypothetical protein [Haloarcula marismortui]|uniref:Uncharacterized protein n=1 Tax=Haloarcula marismortui ATCC 33799 TaxID=662475 RepID=M0KX94_9EURY|nr:hypothetical protein [Haloarcula californiae]EMA24859.1 hypothetical protein C435_03163 [Haloarcula californiae ATCC 33799]